MQIFSLNQELELPLGQTDASKQPLTKKVVNGCLLVRVLCTVSTVYT